MTIDEAIKHCMDIAETQEMCSNGKKCAKEHRQLAEWLKELKALKEQESCEDCISRQAVLDGLASIAKVKAKSDAQKSLMGRVMFFTEHLPPVTPQPKMGQWIRMKAYEKWGCSECHTVFRFTFKEHDYCPNCGAKMQEVEE